MIAAFFKTMTQTFTWFVVSTFVMSSMVHAAPKPREPELDVNAYILIDFDSGAVLAESEADKKLEVASLNKVMTSYVVTDEAHKGQLNLDFEVPVSKRVQSVGGSSMFLRGGSRVPATELIKGLVIQSGNDAALALAEWVGGTERGFVDFMNSYAQKLGMKNTLYQNSSGLPTESEQYSTARDQSILTRNLIANFPEHYQLYKEPFFSYSGIKQRNRNKLLSLDPSVDGVKTGHTNASGYSLISSAKRNGMRLIAVVIGAKSESGRTLSSRQLLEFGFRFYLTQKVVSTADEVLEADVYGGVQEKVSVGVDKDVKLTLPRTWYDQYELHREFEVQDILAPIKKGAKVGKLRIYINKLAPNDLNSKATEKEILAEVDLIANNNILSKGFASDIVARIRIFFKNLFSLD